MLLKTELSVPLLNSAAVITEIAITILTVPSQKRQFILQRNRTLNQFSAASINDELGAIGSLLDDAP